MKYLRVKNWDNFQHYKDRNPPWIKLHRTLLDDYEFCALPDLVKGQLMLIWVFASQNEGKIPQDAKFIERKLGFSERAALQQMVEAGFLLPEQPASTDAGEPLADCKQPASTVLALARSRDLEPTKATETETDARARGFDRFWSAFPRKVAKQDAEKVWSKLKPQGELLEIIISAVQRQAVSEQWVKEKGKYVPHAATWLNGKRWEDQEATPAAMDEYDLWASRTGYGETNAGH